MFPQSKVTIAPFPSGLSARQRLTLAAHVLKAVTRQHHTELAPIIRACLPRNGVAVDVGAHAGQFAKLMARMAPDGHVLAIEPGSYARFILTVALRLNRLRNVSVHAVALSDRPGTLDLSIPIKASGSLGFGLSHIGDAEDRTASRQETIRASTLDELVSQHRLARLDFIKVDIEGWEANLLAGAGATLQRFRPAVMIEIVAGHLRRAGANPSDIWNRFAALGYDCQRIHPDGRLATADPGAGDGDYLFTAKAT